MFLMACLMGVLEGSELSGALLWGMTELKLGPPPKSITIELLEVAGEEGCARRVAGADVWGIAELPLSSAPKRICGGMVGVLEV